MFIKCSTCYLYLVTAAFGHKQISSGDVQPSLNVSALNHYTLQLVGRQWLARSLPICSWPPAFLLLFAPKPTGGSLVLFPHSASSLLPVASHQGQAHADLAGKPLQPISTGKSHTCQPLSLQSWTKDWYLRAFLSWAASQPSSHGTVKSTKIIFWSLVDHSTRSEQSVVCTTSGNFSLLPTSSPRNWRYVAGWSLPSWLWRT